MNINQENKFISTTLQNYHALKAENKLEAAQKVLESATACSCFPAKLELARFLRDTPALNMSRIERFERAEALYLECISQLGLSGRTTARIAYEVASLYSVQNRPLACLGFLLMARRYGFNISDNELENCKQQFRKIDINAPGSEQDAFVLGLELYLDGTAGSMAEYFLCVAADSDDDSISGMACLMLADHYASLSKDNPVYKKEALQSYRLAKEKGYPDYISPQKRGKM